MPGSARKIGSVVALLLIPFGASLNSHTAFAGEVETLSRQLAHAPTRGLARIKEAIYASAENNLPAQLDLERDFMRELGKSDDYREGVAAFMAKRSPSFTGR